jgi:hypothetical protein
MGWELLLLSLELEQLDEFWILHPQSLPHAEDQ